VLKAFDRKPAPQSRQALAPVLAKRLPISHPRDPAEREAARLAAPLARGESVHPVESIGPRLHRDCAACWSGACECERPILRESEGTSAPDSVSRDDVGNLQGAPLPEDVRAPLEQQLGADLSDVRVDDGPQAAEAARKLQARAFTIGDNIGFARGAFQPSSLRGLELLAHELVHVVQQRDGGTHAVLRDDDDDPDQLKQEKKEATEEYDKTAQKHYDDYENETLGLTKASYLRRWLLYTKDGPPESWNDVQASLKAAEVYEDEDKSIKLLGNDVVDMVPEAFPETWYLRLDPVLVLPFDISFAEKEQNDAWGQLHSLSTGMTSTLYPVGLPVMFDEALQLHHFSLIRSHSLFSKHPLGPVAGTGNLYLEKKYVVDVQKEWLSSAKRFARSVREGTAAVTNESFQRFRMYISAVMHPDRAVQSDITLAQAFGEIPADLEKVDVVMSKVASWIAFGRWFIGWKPVQEEFQRGLALVDTKIAGTNPYVKLALGQKWADLYGYSDEVWKRIKEEFIKNLPDMLKEAGIFIAIQFVPGLNLAADIYMIAKSAIDAIEAAWDTAEAMDDVMSSKRVVDLQRHSAELGFKGRANALRIAGDLLAIKASMKAIKMRAAKARVKAEAEARAKAKASGQKVPPTAKAPHIDTPDPQFKKWMAKLNPETRKFLDENPDVAALFAATDPAVRDLLSLCASFCIPKSSTPRQHARIKALIDSGKIDGTSRKVKEFFHRHADDLDRVIDDVENAKGADGVRAVLEGKGPPRKPLVAGQPEHKLQRWRDYQDAHPDRFPKPSDKFDAKWSKQYDTIIANNQFGSAFEREGLQKVGADLGMTVEKNQLIMFNPNDDVGGFIPDGVFGPRGGVVKTLEWGKPYHFIEVKGWGDMSRTGNLWAMIQYVEKTPGSKLTVVFRSSKHPSGVTNLSVPLRQALDNIGATVKWIPE
jgi:hypothetical protein